MTRTWQVKAMAGNLVFPAILWILLYFAQTIPLKKKEEVLEDLLEIEPISRNHGKRLGVAREQEQERRIGIWCDGSRKGKGECVI